MMWGRPVRGSCVTKAAVLAAAFLLFALGAPLVAQPLHYGISPAEIELVPPPGGTASGILVVYNQSERRIRFTVSLEDIFIRPSGTMDVLAPGSVPWSAVALSKVTPAQFDLDPSRTIGYLLFLDPAGQQVSRIALPDTLFLPWSMRDFRPTWGAAVLSPGSYTLRAVVDYGGAALVAGEIAFTARKP